MKHLGNAHSCNSNRQGCDRYKYFGSPNQIQNHIRLDLLVLTDTKIRYHYRKVAKFVSPNQIQIQIGLVLLVRTNTCDDKSQPCMIVAWNFKYLSTSIGKHCLTHEVNRIMPKALTRSMFVYLLHWRTLW